MNVTWYGIHIIRFNISYDDTQAKKLIAWIALSCYYLSIVSWKELVF